MNEVFLNDSQFLNFKNNQLIQKVNDETQGFQRYFLKSQKLQYGINFLINAFQNQGKSTLIKKCINMLKGESSMIYYFTSLQKDLELEKFQNEFGEVFVQVFDENDIQQGMLKNLHQTLQQEIYDFDKFQQLNPKQIRNYKDAIQQLQKQTILAKHEKQKEIQEQIQIMQEQIDFYENNEKRFGKKKYNFVQNFIVFDDIDIGNSGKFSLLKDIKIMLRQIRHYYKTNIYFTIQSLQMLPYQIRELFQVFIIFGDQSKQRLELIYEQLRCQLTKEQFFEIYKQSTKGQFKYLIINSFFKTVFQFSPNEKGLTKILYFQ